MLHARLHLISADPRVLGGCVDYIEGEVRPAVQSQPGSLGLSGWPVRNSTPRYSNRSGRRTKRWRRASSQQRLYAGNWPGGPGDR